MKGSLTGANPPRPHGRDSNAYVSIARMSA